MNVRLPAGWMVYADDRILEYLSEEGPASPKQITEDDRITMTRTYANTRLTKLTDAGLTTLIGNGIYQISDEGQDYLTGELDAREIPEPGEEEG